MLEKSRMAYVCRPGPCPDSLNQIEEGRQEWKKPLVQVLKGLGRRGCFPHISYVSTRALKPEPNIVLSLDAQHLEAVLLPWTLHQQAWRQLHKDRLQSRTLC